MINGKNKLFEQVLSATEMEDSSEIVRVLKESLDSADTESCEWEPLFSNYLNVRKTLLRLFPLSYTGRFVRMPSGQLAHSASLRKDRVEPWDPTPSRFFVNKYTGELYNAYAWTQL